jgi:xanthine dehydrogenase accessory factor
MRELLTTLDEWAASDPEMALATVVRTSGSTPRPVGARLLVGRDGRMAGSVSGGCLESAVVVEAQATLAGTAPPRVLHYGISDELGWEVGLACGGNVEVFVETLRWDGSDPALTAMREAIDSGHAVALLSAVAGPHVGARAAIPEGAPPVGNVVDPADTPMLVTIAEQRMATGIGGMAEVGAATVFVEPIVPAPQLVVIGAVHIAIPLAAMARAAGYRVTVVDPRKAFLTEERLGAADRLVAAWPDDALPGLGLGERDAAVCLAHDPKFEDPALTVLLRSRVGYIGAIGSRSTHARRVGRLREAGFDDGAITRIHSPVGLDLGAATPEEIALSILAEVVAVRRGRAGGVLSTPAVATVA